MNILIAEDEKDIRNLIELHLSKEDFKVFEAEDGLEAISIFGSEHIDLAILDVMMPNLDGIGVIKHIREKSEIPVIFLTAKSEDHDKILGLGLGADDYMVKPFSPIELLARVNAQLRRYYKYSSGKTKSEITLGELKIDKDSCAVFKNSEPLELNAKEFKILELLMDNPGKVYTKKQLYELVWCDTYYGDDNTIMVHISHIRDKIETNPKAPKYLKTIRGIGYKMERM
ncbi:DNA-binding response regulator, OmpR family, contains REC and winged-helix (wHTH) domain [Clostridium cavendishii DSM 21758]|uniref:Stage 0 sporulation protein A homolog n=1 Tax=Clostridium cavendishii DSM 21758 TaxID=1121302 RepID=A0A1M6NRE8_9CLOT|nr:response regulator transcription factor [Clostridium cavendishii]SHJ98196.1 DNA-binding response regulator, OmpR family, contains REC and winged-helix (wHTH) domain [Clostridium cavendishii DSM 21758]